MSGIYEIWKAYAMSVVEAVMTCIDRTDGLPDVLAMGVLALPLIAIKWFLPLWAAMPIYAAIGLPMVWFFAGMFWTLFTCEHKRQYR